MLRTTRQPQHHRQLTEQLKPRFYARLGRRVHLHAINQRPRCLQGFSAAIGQKGLPQARHLGAIDLSEIAVQSGKLRASLCRRNLRTQILLALLQFIEPALKAWSAEPIGDRIDQAIQLAVDGLKLTAPADQPRASLGAKAVPLGGEFGDEGCHQFRFHEP
ncbi:MAG: hypothetical protein ING31_13060 [Burkholderiales bacterium]|nr:hypothetical protein [Burkholderiales bacterium]